MFLLIFLLLLFGTALLCAKPTLARLKIASIILVAIALLWGFYTVMFGFASAMIGGFAGKGETDSLTFVFRTFGVVPYCLWVAVTVLPTTAFAKARKWDIWMHFVYAPIYWLISYFPPSLIAKLFFQDDRTMALNSIATLPFESGAMIVCILLCWYRITNIGTHES